MQVSIRSRNVELSDRLKDVTTEKITRLVKYLDGMDNAEVRFSLEKNPRIAEKEVCEVTLHGHGHHVRAKASAADSLAAMDLVVDKLSQQLTKLKGKLVTRRHQTSKANKAAGIIEDAAPEQEAVDEAKVMKKKQFVIDPMSVDEAALHMDLLQHDFFLFTNAETGRAAVIYRRDDGHLGLIDAEA